MLTILVPTKDRSDYLERLLEYYDKTAYMHEIIIGDSSGSYHLNKNRELTEKFQNRLKIAYYEYPGLSNKECMNRMIKNVSTKYVVYLADDDILTTGGLEMCIKFLENHLKYNSACGIGILFELKGSEAHGRISNITQYQLPDIESETASERLFEYLSNYSVSQFCVHRKDVWEEMYKHSNLMEDRVFGEELSPCCRSIILGPAKQVDDVLYLARQAHERRYELPDIHDWINSDNWEISREIFIDTLTDALSKKDMISREHAQTNVEKAFKIYLDKRLIEVDHRRKIKAMIDKKMKVLALKSLGPFYAKWLGNQFGIGNPANLSLPALLHPSSKYHKEFMPVYHALARTQKYS